MPAADNAESAAPDANTLGTAFEHLDLDKRPSVLVAVSGGSDSTALLLSFHEFLHRRPNAPRLVAATVDHGLRSGSNAEARAVAYLCETLAIQHRTLIWPGEKPLTGIPAAARDARYALLAECAGAVGTDLVLTGHTADDQAETVAMRQARVEADGQDRGLAGIAPATLWRNAIWFARPLLTQRRSALQAFLDFRHVGWASDPSNSDRRFERTRVRQDGALEIERMLAIASHAAAERIAMARQAADLIATAKIDEAGRVYLPRGTFAPSPQSSLALRLMLATLGERAHLPDAARADALLNRLAIEAAPRTTLAGVVISAGPEAIVLKREDRAEVKRVTGGPFAELLPSFDLAAARALAHLFGKPAVRAPPWPN